MKLEKIINGYMMIALFLLFIMGRLLEYALTMDFWGGHILILYLLSFSGLIDIYSMHD